MNIVRYLIGIVMILIGLALAGWLIQTVMQGQIDFSLHSKGHPESKDTALVLFGSIISLAFILGGYFQVKLYSK